MQLLNLFLLIVISSIMLIQDLKYRAISWVLFPVFFAIILMWSWQNVFFWFQSVLINLSFISLNLLLMIIWFSLKKVNPKQLLKEYVGVGDLLLFLVLALSLPYYVFLPFQIASLIIGMVLGVLLFKNRTVPLAGIQASLLVLMFGATQVFHLPMWKLEYLLL